MTPQSPNLDAVRAVLADVLGLADGGAGLAVDTPLIGALPELDSMAVVSVITTLEEHFGIVVDDEAIGVELFETLGSLTDFVDSRL